MKNLDKVVLKSSLRSMQTLQSYLREGYGYYVEEDHYGDQPVNVHLFSNEQDAYNFADKDKRVMGHHFHCPVKDLQSCAEYAIDDRHIEDNEHELHKIHHDPERAVLVKNMEVSQNVVDRLEAEIEELRNEIEELNDEIDCMDGECFADDEFFNWEEDDMDDNEYYFDDQFDLMYEDYERMISEAYSQIAKLNNKISSYKEEQKRILENKNSKATKSRPNLVILEEKRNLLDSKLAKLSKLTESKKKTEAKIEDYRLKISNL